VLAVPGRAWQRGVAARQPAGRPRGAQAAILTCTARADAPAASVVGVGPQQVAHRTLVRHLHTGWQPGEGGGVADIQREGAGLIGSGWWVAAARSCTRCRRCRCTSRLTSCGLRQPRMQSCGGRSGRSRCAGGRRQEGAAARPGGPGVHGLGVAPRRLTSWTRSSALMWSSVSSVGDRPPCKQKICARARGGGGGGGGPPGGGPGRGGGRRLGWLRQAAVP